MDLISVISVADIVVTALAIQMRKYYCLEPTSTGFWLVILLEG